MTSEKLIPVTLAVRYGQQFPGETAYVTADLAKSLGGGREALAKAAAETEAARAAAEAEKAAKEAEAKAKAEADAKAAEAAKKAAETGKKP